MSSRAELVDEAGASDRVLVQRAAFARSSFTVERWRTMKRSPAGGLAVEALVRTPAGEPAAAATAWFAGVGRCGLLEPVGTHPDHRGHGYGRDAARLSPIGGRARSPVVNRPQTTPRWRSIDRPGSPSCVKIAIGFALDGLERRTCESAGGVLCGQSGHTHDTC